MALGHTTTYTTSGAYSPVMNAQGFPHHCVCCDRQLGLPSGDRGLCDGCDEDIPHHIPREQYLTYMKEKWRKR
jgi:hypothetical protein